MTFKKSEKDIIKAIVKYGGEVKSLAKIINKSQLLESRGIVIAFASGRNYVFLDKNKYEWDDKRALGYVYEFISLLQYLADNRLISFHGNNDSGTIVLGRKQAKWVKPNYIAVEDALLEVEGNMGNWYDVNNRQTYWPNCYLEQELPIARYLDCWLSVSQELKDLVKNNFKTEEQIRFDKQQRLTWISIAVASGVGVLSLILSVINLLIR